MEFQQSALYGKYIRSLSWNVYRIDGVQVFYKKIPLLGGILKIQRPHTLPNLKSFLATHSVKTIAIEPTPTQDVMAYKLWCRTYEKSYTVTRSGYMPTKTIIIDIRANETDIFQRFTEAKRRAVRRAQKNGITVEESHDITALIRIKNTSGGFFGFITTFGIDKFWDLLSPTHSTILLAYRERKVIGGVLLVFWQHTAFYWIAGASKKGKQFFAPTLLVWESLKIAKARGAKQFDFVGVWDERLPKDHTDWKGFTKFKEGFGGTSLYYPVYGG